MSFDRVCNLVCVGNALDSLFQAILECPKSLVEKTTAFLMNIYVLMSVALIGRLFMNIQYLNFALLWSDNKPAVSICLPRHSKPKTMSGILPYVFDPESEDETEGEDQEQPKTHTMNVLRMVIWANLTGI